MGAAFGRPSFYLRRLLMFKLLSMALAAFGLVAAAVAFAGGGAGPFVPNVDDKGDITLPKDFRAGWTHLGSWAVPAPSAPMRGMHDVYTQPESVAYYKQNGKFPDGAVIVMEVRKAEWKEMATGHVVSEGVVDGWFVMVKDDKGRYPGNANWGDGWGWARFNPGDPAVNISRDYKVDCLPCHERERKNGLVHVWGYPTIR